ncbi:MAG: hypothetical protein HDT42_05440 [Ruminococcaceae bacterium]|nr:hypothetical protein [Oscillospiraceae bacterium]
MKDIHFVGKINVEIFKVITEDIQTDEVIITEERIAHIANGHPDAARKYLGYLREIVENPCYIVEANKPYSALILNPFSNGEELFKTVLRLKTSYDDPDFKNSIITFMNINEKEWKRVLKNKKVLYKRE